MSPELGDLSNITVRDLRDVESVIERPIGALFTALSGGDMSLLDADTLAALLWVRMRKDDPELTLDDVFDLDLGALGAEISGPKSYGGPDSVTGLLVRLSRAWGCSPGALRDLTLAELAEMATVLGEEARRR